MKRNDYIIVSPQNIVNFLNSKNPDGYIELGERFLSDDRKYVHFGFQPGRTIVKRFKQAVIQHQEISLLHPLNPTGEKGEILVERGYLTDNNGDFPYEMISLAVSKDIHGYHQTILEKGMTAQAQILLGSGNVARYDTFKQGFSTKYANLEEMIPTSVFLKPGVIPAQTTYSI